MSSMQYSIPDKFLVAIDGIGGSGKDTLAANLAASGIFSPFDPFILNQGDLVRAFACIVKQENISLQNPAINEIAVERIKAIDFSKLNRDEMSSSETGKMAAELSAIPGFTDMMVNESASMLRDAKSPVCLVLGRICGASFHAQKKLYLEAYAEICEQRRAKELQRRGESYEYAKESLALRNNKDKQTLGNKILPVKEAIIVNANLFPEQVCQQAIEIIKPSFIKWQFGR
jgi:cytidylate kinase